MLVQCKSCNVSFDDAFGKCIACGEPITLSRAELREQCIRMAREWYRQGKKTQEIHNELTGANSFSDREADEIIRAVKQQRQDAARRRGRHAAVIGLIFLGIGIGLSILSLGLVVFIGFLLFGVVLFLGGLFTSLTGWDITGDSDD